MWWDCRVIIGGADRKSNRGWRPQSLASTVPRRAQVSFADSLDMKTPWGFCRFRCSALYVARNSFRLPRQSLEEQNRSTSILYMNSSLFDLLCYDNVSPKGSLVHHSGYRVHKKSGQANMSLRTAITPWSSEISQQLFKHSHPLRFVEVQLLKQTGCSSFHLFLAGKQPQAFCLVGDYSDAVLKGWMIFRGSCTNFHPQLAADGKTRIYRLTESMKAFYCCWKLAIIYFWKSDAFDTGWK